MALDPGRFSVLSYSRRDMTTIVRVLMVFAGYFGQLFAVVPDTSHRSESHGNVAQELSFPFEVPHQITSSGLLSRDLPSGRITKAKTYGSKVMVCFYVMLQDEAQSQQGTAKSPI